MHRWLFAAALMLALAGLARDRFDVWVADTDLPPLMAQTSQEVLARDGTLLRAFTVADGRWRLAVHPSQVDPGFIEMLVAYEDKRFYRHAGVDPRAMLRAAWQATWNGQVVSGGSTLSMQVARLLEDGPTGEWHGKLRQIRVALAMERQLSKAQILGLYLNRAPYGGNLEGVRAATRAYFGKEPRRLTPAEAALLVALPQSPEARRPDRDPRAATAARDRVLNRVVGGEAGLAAKADPVPTRRQPFPATAPHLTERLRTENPLMPQLRTTLDAALQAKLEVLATEAVRAEGARLSVAILVADHRSGEVLARLGSAQYAADGRAGFVDMTRALRSPGSTLKPLVYGLAFDEGLAHPETLIEDRPVDFNGYAPVNFDGEFRGTVRVREALQLSLNLPVVTLTEAIGPEKLVAHLRRSGARPSIPGGRPGLAVSLGGLGLTLEDLVRLYAALANGGRVVPLHSMVPAPEPAGRVMSPEAAWQVGHILGQIPPPPRASHGPLAYKTGTSYGHRDAWAVGFDGAHVIAVWMGRPDGTPVPGAFGGELAAPLLFKAFDRLKDVREALLPPPPAVLLVPNADLPQPLQQFRSRSAAFEAPADAPKLAFPPDGATLEMDGGTELTVKLRDGVPPFTVLANGAPVRLRAHQRVTTIPTPGPGFLRLSVIDAKGRTAAARIELR